MKTIFIIVIFMPTIFTGIIIGVVAFFINLNNQREKKRQKQIYDSLKNKYRTNCVGVFRLYSGLPLPSNAMCEVAFCGNALHIISGHFGRTIPIEYIDNIYIDTIQESYTKTSFFSSDPVVGGLGMLSSAVGNSSRKAAAKKNLLIVHHKAGVIAFHRNSYYGFDKLAANEKTQLTGIRSNYFCLADWIVLKFAEEKVNTINTGEIAEKVW